MTNARAASRPLGFLVAASLAATAHGQTPQFEWQTSIEWPDSLGDASQIGRIVAGDVDGDLRPDVFARGASSPGTPDGSYEILFVYAPWMAGGVMKLGLRSLDFDFRESTRELAVVKNSGLWKVTWDASQDPPFVEAQVASGTPWAGAKKVRCADLDGSAGDDYVVVGSDGHTVAFRRTNSGGTTTVLVDVTYQVVDVVALQWVQSGAQEIAVLTTDHLLFYDGTGSILDTFTPPYSGAGVIASVPFGTDGPDRLAWASRGSGGTTTRFDLVRRASPQVEGPMTPAFTDVSGMATADMDGDGDADLVMSHLSDRTAWVYSSGFAQSTSRVYSASRSQAVNNDELESDEVLVNQATPIFRDLGNDHRADLFLPVADEEGTTFQVFSTKDRLDALSEEVFFEDASHDFDLVLNPGYDSETQFWIRTLDYVPQATHVQVVVWNQESASAYLTGLADSPALYYEIDPGQQSDPNASWQVYDVPVTMATGDDECTMPIRWIEVRLVELGSEDQILDAWPTYTCGVITRVEDFCALDTAANVEMPLTPPVDCGGSPTCSLPEGSWPGDAITRRHKPNPPPGVIPKVQVGIINVGQIPVL